MTWYSICNDPDHSLIQDYVRDLLEFYGFTAKKEDWISPEDRIDVTATGRELKIGVEVHIKGDLDRDIQKLSKYSFDLAFIVGKDIKEGVIEVGGKKIYITDYRLFESKLREVLNENRPRFKPFYEWCMDRLPEQIRPPIIVEDALTKFKRSLTSAGLDNFLEDCLNTLVFIYMAEECCVMYDSRRHIKTGIIDEQILSILRSYNLVWDHARGSSEMRKYFVSLTEEGKKIAQQIISERINKYSKEIDRIISRFGKKIAYIMTVGTVKPTLREYKLEFNLIKDKLSFNLEYSDSDSFVFHPTLKWLDSFYRWSSVFSFCRFMTYTALYEYTKKFFEELRLIGLAVRIPSYGSCGQYHWDSYKVPKEVTNYLLNKLMDVKDELRPLVEEYAVILALYKGGAYTTRRHFDEVVKSFGIPIESIKAELEYLHRIGITSRYIPDEKATPFIVLNKDAFKEYLLTRIKELTNKVLQSSKI